MIGSQPYEFFAQEYCKPVVIAGFEPLDVMHVVSPLFFPGGDIGCLSVHGTLNDVAMAGAARCTWPRASCWR